MIDELFPEACSYCRENKVSIYKPLCQKCLQKVEPIENSRCCTRCGAIRNGNGCLCDERKFFFHQSLFLWPYRKESRKILQSAKFQERGSSIRYLKKNIPFTVWEGFQKKKGSVILMMNSSRHFLDHMAQFLSKEAGLPMYKVFQKKKPKLQSKLLHARDRYAQIEENLILDQSVFQKIIKKKYSSYFIVDDVWTSGATLNFAAKLLTENGIPEESISVLAFFRTEQIMQTQNGN